MQISFCYMYEKGNNGSASKIKVKENDFCFELSVYLYPTKKYDIQYVYSFSWGFSHMSQYLLKWSINM